MNSARRDGSSDRGFWLLPFSLFCVPFSPAGSVLGFGTFVAWTAVRIDWKEKFGHRQVAWLAIAILTAIAWFALRTNSPLGLGLSDLGKARTPITLFDYAPFLFAFFVLSLRNWTDRERRALVTALALSVPIVFVLALIERQLSVPFRLLVGPEGFRAVEIILTPLHELRTKATFFNPNGLATWVLFAGLASVSVSTERSSSSKPLLWLGRAAVVCTLLLWIWSASRATWVALSVTLVLLCGTLRLRKRYWLVPLVAWWALVFLAIGEANRITQAARTVVPRVVWARASGSTDPDVRTSGTHWRQRVFLCAIDLSREKPILGWGTGQFAPECEDRVGFRMINHAHNLFLQLSSEQGVPFAVLLCSLLGWFHLSAWRHWGRQRGSPHESDALALLLAAFGLMMVSQLNLAWMHMNELAILFWTALASVFGPSLAGRDNSL